MTVEQFDRLAIRIGGALMVLLALTVCVGTWWVMRWSCAAGEPGWLTSPLCIGWNTWPLAVGIAGALLGPSLSLATNRLAPFWWGIGTAWGVAFALWVPMSLPG